MYVETGKSEGGVVTSGVLTVTPEPHRNTNENRRRKQVISDVSVPLNPVSDVHDL